MRRNEARNEPRCKSVRLEDMARGPGYVAWQFIERAKHRDPPIIFNEEQLDCIALQIWDIEEAFRKKQNDATALDILPGSHVLIGGSTQAIRSKHMLPNDLGLPRSLTVGGGGCGKTTMLLEVICPTYETFFERIDRATPSNKSARLFNAKTVHSLNGIKPSDSLRTINIRIRTDAMRKRTQAVHNRSGALFIDEYGQLQAQLYHANNLLWTVARQSRYNLTLEDYAKPRETAGRISKLSLSGDHLQLPPVPKSASLHANIEGTNDEHKAGAAMFASIEQVFVLETMMRFHDPVLKRILEQMRTPGGASLTDHEWTALKKTIVDVESLDPEKQREFYAKTQGWHHSCYLWSIVTLAAYTCSKMSAERSHHTLFYLQAVDVPRVPPRHKLPDEITGQPRPETVALYERMLQVQNLSVTKRLPGWACFHQGMRVRITMNVLPPYAVQDSTGTIQHMALHPDDQHSLRGATPPAEYKLRYAPTLYIQLDDVAHEFLPPVLCEEHRELCHVDDAHRNNIYDTCLNCKRFPGLFQLTPQKSTWYYTDDKENYQSSIDRLQLPIMPIEACPLYGLQGTTADPGLCAHWAMPRRMDAQVKWLLVYVMLSRVRALDCLASFGWDNKIREIIEGGPPEELVGNFEKLSGEKAKLTRIAAREARKNLGWPTPDA